MTQTTTITPDLAAALECHKEEVIAALATAPGADLGAFDRLKTHPDAAKKATYLDYLKKVHAAVEEDRPWPDTPEEQALEEEVYELQCMERVAIAKSTYHHLIGYLPSQDAPPIVAAIIKGSS